MVNLRIPGPIPVPDDILDKMSTQMMNHRGPKFKEMLFRITDGLKQVFQTENDIFDVPPPAASLPIMASHVAAVPILIAVGAELS